MVPSTLFEKENFNFSECVSYVWFIRAHSRNNDGDLKF